MYNEQEVIVKNFRKYHTANQRIVLYGTGINAEAIVNQCDDYKIIGLMDATKTGEILWGLKVLSEEEILSLNVQKIIIVARPAVHSIIYKRIKKFVEMHNIKVFDVYGDEVYDDSLKTVEDIEYFHVSYEDLWSRIREHEVITFDVFDTLLSRKVYKPEDVFGLVKSDDICSNFVEIRQCAERELNGCVNIYDIYEYIKEICHISEDAVQELILREIEKEKQVLCTRESMVECLHQCVQSGKEVYLVSDMYLPRVVLEEILNQKGIGGYKELLVSCEYGVSKADGLFNILKSKIGSKTCLHIGDNHERDYLYAMEAGIDAFEIYSPVKMMESSTYKIWLAHIDSIENRVLLGMLATKIFNNPFVLFESNGKPYVDNIYNFGYIYIAPLALMFVSWLINCVQNEKDASILFASRDGYLFQRIYQEIKKILSLKNLPEDVYLLVSRRLISEIGSECTEREKYLEYINRTNCLSKKNIFFVDFMSKGTCQLGLEKLMGRTLKGLYLQRSITQDENLNSLYIQALYEEKSAMEKNKRIFAMCDFLECVFTSFMPSIKTFSHKGLPVYEKERRTKEQLKVVEELHGAILDFVCEFYNIHMKQAKEFINADFCDEILRVTSSEFTRSELPDIEKISLDDACGVYKNVGVDILR